MAMDIRAGLPSIRSNQIYYILQNHILQPSAENYPVKKDTFTNREKVMDMKNEEAIISNLTILFPKVLSFVIFL